MSNAKVRRIRKHRRLNRMRIKTGKKVVRHKSKTGRTGQIWHKKKQNLLEKVRKEMKRRNREYQFSTSREL